MTGLAAIIHKAELLLAQIQAELFASKPVGKARAKVAEYEDDLEAEYEQWAKETAAKLARAKENERKAILAAALLLLLALLKRAGEDALPEAIEIALDGADPTDEIESLLNETIDENDGFLEDSLIPDIEARALDKLSTPEIIAAIAAGTGAAAIAEMLGGFTQRTGSYSGEFWKLYNKALGVIADENKTPLKAYLDPAAKHCSECPKFHEVDGREYASYAAYLEKTDGRVPGEFECAGNCRCWLEFQSTPANRQT